MSDIMSDINKRISEAESARDAAISEIAVRFQRSEGDS